ncbi:hypothetical protein TIFTF001_037654 [Ficus carica]|uniref:MULE transposase domain-containing protein n=1 Tax=Ficus carica TaxID=3494 RepID=A0AA88J978_FICCA|nr:hypothetical protein TIFTF001_037654 [Ficus carica]
MFVFSSSIWSMKEILVPETATYIDLIELVRSAIGIRGPAKTIVMRYGVEPGLPLVRIHRSDATGAGGQLSREGVQSDEAMQYVDDRNLIIPHPPPHIPHLPPHVDELKFAGNARQSNKNSIAASIGAHSITNNTTSQSVNIPSRDSVSGSVVVADYTPVTMRRNFLPAWAEMVKRKNHGSDIDIETDSANCLQCFYMCLAASKHGWPYCRPVIVVDGSASSKHACGHDANGCIFPLAFGIVLSESNESWKWFFEKLRDSIGTRESLAIVADRHKGIEFAANLVYPDAAFGICVQHLASNLKTKYKDFKGHLKTYFDGASRSYLLTQMAGMFLKKSGHKLSILPKQSVGPEGHGFKGFCPKEKNMSLFGVVDVMVMDTTDKHVPI